MPHAFRIGPLEAPDGHLFLYAARSSSTGMVETSQASDDVTGLRTLSEVLQGEPLVVEPSLAKAAKTLGLRKAPLPADVAHEKATVALGLVLRMNELVGRGVSPSHISDLLDAAIAFSTAAPWRFVDGVPGSAGEGPLMMDAMASVGLWRKPVELMVREEARSFLDRPSDVLGGLTPRAAVTKASSRRALHQWLKELEHGEAQGESGGLATFVREALELSIVGELAPADEYARRTGRGRKVSETLLDFAAPMLEELYDPTPIRPSLEFAALVWNVDVLEQTEGRTDASKAMNAILERAGLREAEQWLERLRARRRLFADDERLIEVLEVRWDDGNIYVKALARLAPPKAKAPGKPRRASKKQLGLFE